MNSIDKPTARIKPNKYECHGVKGSPKQSRPPKPCSQFIKNKGDCKMSNSQLEKMIIDHIKDINSKLAKTTNVKKEIELLKEKGNMLRLLSETYK